MFYSYTVRPALARFAKDEDASLSVELVLILPLLIWGFLTVYTVFDVFRHRNLALKANYAVSDLLSRETASINNNYLNGAASVYKYLTQGGANTWIRVSSIYCNDNCGNESSRELVVEWSRATGGQNMWNSGDIKTKLGHAIPLLAYGEYAIIVETSVDHEPPFVPPMLKTISRPGYDSGWGFMKKNTFRDIVITEPRFGPKLCWNGVGGCA